MSKTFNSRIQLKTDTKANWEKATNFIPKLGEVCVYIDYLETTNDNGENVYIPGMKIGDGIKYINELEFIQEDYITDAQVDEILGESSSDNNFSQLLIDFIEGNSIKSFTNNEITSIRKYCFYGQTGLEEINCPKVNFIDDHAFEGCLSLSKILINEEKKNSTGLGEKAFYGCSSFPLFFYFYGISLGKNEIFANSGIRFLNWESPFSVVEICGDQIFKNSKLYSIKMGTNIQSIYLFGENIFYNSPIETLNNNYQTIDESLGIIVSNNNYKKMIDSDSIQKKYKYLLVPENKTNIKHYVFYINNVPYSFEENMTFSEWINSYFTYSDNFIDNGTFIKNPENNFTLTLNNAEIYSGSKIALGQYYFWKEPQDNEPS